METSGCLIKGASFETILPRLVSAFEQGQLVPFSGAGLSVPACRLWTDFVGALGEKAGIPFEVGSKTLPDELVMQANKAVARLRARGTNALAKNVREALFNGDPKDPPPQTKALARLWWPIALTTNYDDCYVTAFREMQGTEVIVCGRNAVDSQKVLTALREPGEPLLWAIQGYLGGPCSKTTDELAPEIVVGHEEYRRVAYAEAQFRRAFAEVFRSRSLLFVGSGLQEPYFREMFSEILEIYGPCDRPHYAFIKKGSGLDIQFLATRFQTIVVEYSDHNELPRWLDQLAEAVKEKKRAFRQDRVSFTLREARLDDADIPCSRLSVVRGPLKRPEPETDTCLAVDAGGLGAQFDFSDPSRRLLDRVEAHGKPVLNGRKYVARYDGQPVFAIRARADGLRPLGVIRPASLELFDTAWQDGFRHICMQILATGDSGSGRSEVDVPPFSGLFSLVESVRAFGQWCNSHPDRPLELILHLVDLPLAMEITSGRLDLQELLSSKDLRFWAKVIYPDGRVQRQMCQEKENVTLGEMAEWLGMDVTQWQVQPFPQIGAAEDKPADLATKKDEPLCHWVIPGGTLRFTSKNSGSNTG